MLSPPSLAAIIIVSVLLVFFIIYSRSIYLYRHSYPIRQQSPLLTFVISLALLLSCAVLVITHLLVDNTSPHRRQTILHVTEPIYIFLRELVLIGFYLRCLRISLAYNSFLATKPVIGLFSSEIAMIVVALLLSLIMPVFQIIATCRNQHYEFFRFFPDKRETVEHHSSSYVMWSFDNVIFFAVLIMSLKVSQKFRFVKGLTIAFLLYHMENIYNIISDMVMQADPSSSLKEWYFLVPLVLNIICFCVLAVPSLRPRQYEKPVPTVTILNDPNLMMQNEEALLIFIKYCERTDNMSDAEDQLRRNSSRWLEIYIQIFLLNKQAVQDSLENSQDNLMEAEHQRIKDFVIKFISPNMGDLQLLKDTCKDLFTDEHYDLPASVRGDLTVLQLRPLYDRLSKFVRSLYLRWKRTVSFYEFRNQLLFNQQVIKRMAQLNISL